MKRKFRYLVNRFNDLPMSTKLFMSFFILTIIPMTVIISIVARNFQATERARMEYSANQSFEQAAAVLAFRARYINDIMNLLYMDDTLQRIANNTSNDYITDYGRQLLDSSKLSKLVYSFENKEGISKIKLFVPAASIFAQDHVTYFNIEEAKTKVWYQLLVESPDATLWSPPQYFADEGTSDIIPVLKVVKDLNDFRKSGSIVRIDLSRDDIVEILANAMITESSLVMLCNKDYELICATDNARSAGFLDYLATDYQGDKQQDWTYANDDAREFLVRLFAIEDTDWLLGMSIPVSDMLSSGSGFQPDILVMMIIGILIVYATAFLISRMNTSRLKDFTRLIRQAETGDFSMTPLPKNADEIGELARNFNAMLTKISILLDEKYKLGQQVKSTELKLLQSQINPHFLYNTLDLINWFSYMGKDEELRDVVESLSKFYKLSLNRGDDEITVGDELEHAKAYVDIQNKRFANHIKLVIDVDETLRRIPMIKIILQPIVENAILHGIMEKAANGGTIAIRGRRDGDDILLTVTDDGVGMDEQALLNLRDGVESLSGASYGLKNINERLESSYGKGYGLKYASVKGQGTAVTIRIAIRPTAERLTDQSESKIVL